MTKQDVSKLKPDTQEPHEHKSIEFALLAAQPNFDDVKKDAENTHFKNKYATLKSLLDAVQWHLHAEGVLITQPIVNTEFGRFVRTTLLHVSSGTKMETDVELIMEKQDMQKFKSASTYARRIGLENLLGISAGDDDDDAEQGSVGVNLGGINRDAWRQGVEDTIPTNATAEQRAEIYAKAICEDFAGKGEKALQNRWNKHKALISGMEGRFPSHHEKIIDAYENEMMRATGQD